MLDVEFIRANQALVQKAAKDKNVIVDIAELLKLDEQRSKLITELDGLRHQRNELAGKSKGKPNAADIETGKQLKTDAAILEKKLKPLEKKYQELLYKVPNVPSQDTPVGKDESGNKVIRKWGEPTKFDFKPKPHWELGAELDLIDSEKAAEVSGARFSYLKGGLVMLQFALIQWILSLLTEEKKLAEIIKNAKLDVPATPFIPILVPVMIKADIFAKTGRKDPVEDKYYLKEDDLFLVGSAEHTLIGYHMNEIFKAENLPVRYIGYSTALRREAGSYGKDVRGILRQHQFDKLEMESFSAPQNSDGEQQLLISVHEYIMQKLGIAYQVVAICTGDMGKPDFRQVDIESWMPGQGTYRETATSDNVTDFQARRLNIKYQDRDGTKKLVYMNDATASALGRMLIAIMENYQTKDGKIKVPEVLKPYFASEFV